MKNEHEFDESLAKVCALLKCVWIDIPDAIISRNDRIYGRIKERQRPFDKVLLTPQSIFMIELKFNNGQLKDHQKIRGNRYNNIRPGSYYVLRAKMNLKNPMFQIENANGDIAFKTPDIIELIRWFLVLDKNQVPN